MVTVIIPAGRDGPSSRQGRPVWLLRLPTGQLALEQILCDLILTNVRRIVFVTLQSHVDKYCAGSTASIEGTIRNAAARQSKELAERMSVDVVVLTEVFDSAPETICRAIELANITGPIFVKDSDGSFQHTVEPGNYVCGLVIGVSSSMDSSSVSGLLSKSFIERTGVLLTNIVEKRLISDTIAVGGYGFASAAEFVKAAQEAIQTQKRMLDVIPSTGAPHTRLFVSHVVQRLLYGDTAFSVSLTRHLDDWKSEESVARYMNSFCNIVVPLEGKLLLPRTEDGLDHPSEYRDLSRYTANNAEIDRLVEMKVNGGNRTRIVILSSQPESQIHEVKSIIAAHAIPMDAVVCGVFLSQTTL